MTNDLGPGTRVRLRLDAIAASRLHLQQHARLRDVGIVTPPHRQSPGMSALYVIVLFENCGQHHRLLPAEIEMDGSDTPG
jgi:hypothetical protein